MRLRLEKLSLPSFSSVCVCVCECVSNCACVHVCEVQKLNSGVVSEDFLRVTLAVKNSMIKSYLGERGVLFLFFIYSCKSQPITEGNLNRAGTWRQQLKEKPWGMLLTGLLSLLSYSAQGLLPRNSTTHSRLSIAITKTTHYSFAHREILSSHFHN